MGFRTKLQHTLLYIEAAAVLHNLARALNDPRPPDNLDLAAAGHPGDNDDGNGDDEPGQQGQQDLSAAAARVQGKLFRERIFQQEWDLIA
jgi:hypothetical protein